MAPETCVCVVKYLTMSEVQGKIVSRNFSHVVFSLLSTLGSTGLGLALHGTVQSGLVWHGPIQHAKLRRPHIFRHQI